MMAGMPGEYRLYQELADWWPLISPPGEYVAEAAYLARLFAAAPIKVHDVLDLGSGGGHVAVHLKDRLDLTLVDLSAGMLAVSQRLNPECGPPAGRHAHDPAGPDVRRRPGPRRRRLRD